MNVGARSVQTGQHYPSKAALRKAVQEDPTDVLFYSTAAVPGIHEQGDMRASELTIFSPTMYVVGPDPYTSRKYYGTVNRKEVRGYPKTIIS